MRRLALSFSLWALLITGISPVNLQAQSAANKQEEMPHDTLGPWKITNTLLFAALLGFMLYKYGPPFFNARSSDIQKAIKDATGLKLDADYRYSEADRKMATLGEEIKRLRAEGATALEREHDRIRRETQAGIDRIMRNVTIETEAFRHDGVQQLRLHTTRAAVALAQNRLRERAAAGASPDLVPDFVHLVERDDTR